MNFLKFLLLLTVVLSLFACGKESCSQINNVAVNTPISRGEHLKVYAPSGWVYADGGVCGLIVYNDRGNLVAYDRCSTVERGQGNRVEVIDDILIVDPVSGAKWLLTDGSPADIATCSLWRYAVSRTGDIYYVRN